MPNLKPVRLMQELLRRFTIVLCFVLPAGCTLFAEDRNDGCRKAIDLTTNNSYDSVGKTETGLRRGITALQLEIQNGCLLYAAYLTLGDAFVSMGLQLELRNQDSQAEVHEQVEAWMQKARYAFHRQTHFFPQDQTSWLRYASTFRHPKSRVDVAEKIRACRKAVEVAPVDVGARIALGSALLEPHAAEALAEFLKAYDLARKSDDLIHAGNAWHDALVRLGLTQEEEELIRRIEKDSELGRRFDEAVYLIEHHCPDCVGPDRGKLEQGVFEVEASLAAGARDKAHGYLLLAAAYLDLASGLDSRAVGPRQANTQGARRWLDRLKQEFPGDEGGQLYNAVALLAGGNDQGRTALRQAIEQTKVALNSDLVEHAAATLARFGLHPEASELRGRAQKRHEVLEVQRHR